jgi:hypothetical protein
MWLELIDRAKGGAKVSAEGLLAEAKGASTAGQSRSTSAFK